MSDSITSYELHCIVQSPLGIHARPAAMLAQTAQSFQSDIRISTAALSVNAKSILDILSLAATQGTRLRISASGPDCKQAVESLAELLHNSFMPAQGTTMREQP